MAEERIANGSGASRSPDQRYEEFAKKSADWDQQVKAELDKLKEAAEQVKRAEEPTPA